MIHELTEQVWFGDMHAVSESMGSVRSIINVAHTCRRNPEYWPQVGRIMHDVLFFRAAKKDREHWGVEYANLLVGILETIKQAGAFPLLTHCQLGGHRGPSSALFAAWHFGGRSRLLLEQLNYRVACLVPGLENGLQARGDRCLYYKQIIAYCSERSV